LNPPMKANSVAGGREDVWCRKERRGVFGVKVFLDMARYGTLISDAPPVRPASGDTLAPLSQKESGRTYQVEAAGQHRCQKKGEDFVIHDLGIRLWIEAKKLAYSQDLKK